MMNVSPQAVSNWKSRYPSFPQAVAELAVGPIYSTYSIEQWCLSEKKGSFSPGHKFTKPVFDETRMQEKITQMWCMLSTMAHGRRTIQFQDLSNTLGVEDYKEMTEIIMLLKGHCINEGTPILTSLIISSSNVGRPFLKDTQMSYEDLFIEIEKSYNFQWFTNVKMPKVQEIKEGME